MIWNYLKFLNDDIKASPKTTDKIIGGLFVILATYFLTMILYSFRWGMILDAPIMLYISYAINSFNMAPYSEIFDFNMPGVHFFYSIFIYIFGTGDIGFRVGDILYLMAIMITSWFWMRNFSKRIAWFSSILFGIVYLAFGPTVSLQREFILILPIAVALLVGSSNKFGYILKYFIIGLMFGLAAIIKPHAILGFPLMIIYLLYDNEINDSTSLPILSTTIRRILYALTGLLLPLLCSLIYLLSINALPNLIDIIVNYWPLYGDLTGAHKTIWGTDKILYLIRGFLNFGDNTLWMIPSAVGVYIALRSTRLTRNQKRKVFLMVGMAIVYGIFPVFAGKFWPYHWLLMLYFLVLLSTLCLIKIDIKQRFERLYPLIIFVIILIPGIRPSDNLLYDLVMPDIVSSQTAITENKRAVEIAEYLEKNIRPNDLVQPLDWTGGAVHAMLISKAKIATPFIYDFHFYHHVSRPYTQYLRKIFMESLAASKPRFIIQILDNKPWPNGYDTSREFRELSQFLQTFYIPSVNGRGYNIFTRI